MGVSSSVYVGPYIRCKNPSGERTVYDRACANNDCLKFADKYAIRHDQKFCTECGSEIHDDVPSTKKGPLVSISHVMDRMLDLGRKGEVFYTPHRSSDYPGANDNDVWVLNMDVGTVTHNIDPMYEEIVDLKNVDISSEIAALKKAIPQELAVLDECYGADKVTIHWGVVSYVS